MFFKAKILFGRQKIIMVGFAAGTHLRYFDWVWANGCGNGKSEKDYPIFHTNSLIQAKRLQGT